MFSHRFSSNSSQYPEIQIVCQETLLNGYVLKNLDFQLKSYISLFPIPEDLLSNLIKTLRSLFSKPPLLSQPFFFFLTSFFILDLFCNVNIFFFFFLARILNGFSFNGSSPGRIVHLYILQLYIVARFINSTVIISVYVCLSHCTSRQWYLEYTEAYSPWNPYAYHSV